MAYRLVPSRLTSDDLERSKVKIKVTNTLSSNNSKTVRDTMLVTIDDLWETDPGLSNETIADVLGWPWKVKGQGHEYLSSNISKTVRGMMFFNGIKPVWAALVDTSISSSLSSRSTSNFQEMFRAQCNTRKPCMMTSPGHAYFLWRQNPQILKIIISGTIHPIDLRFGTRLSGAKVYHMT